MYGDQWQCPCGTANIFLRSKCRTCAEPKLPDEVCEPFLVALERHTQQKEHPMREAYVLHHGPHISTEELSDWMESMEYEIRSAAAGRVGPVVGFNDKMVKVLINGKICLTHFAEGDPVRAVVGKNSATIVLENIDEASVPVLPETKPESSPRLARAVTMDRELFDRADQIAEKHLKRRWWERELSLLVRKIRLRTDIYNALREERGDQADS